MLRRNEAASIECRKTPARREHAETQSLNDVAGLLYSQRQWNDDLINACATGPWRATVRDAGCHHGSAVRVSLWQAVCCECGSRDAITRCGSDQTGSGSGSSIVETAGNVVVRGCMADITSRCLFDIARCTAIIVMVLLQPRPAGGDCCKCAELTMHSSCVIARKYRGP